MIHGRYVVAVRDEAPFAVKFGFKRCVVHFNSAFFLQVFVCPHVVVAVEEVYFYSGIREPRQCSEQTCEPFWNNTTVFIPEIEHVADNEYGISISSHLFQPLYEQALSFERLFVRPEAEVHIRCEIVHDGIISVRQQDVLFLCVASRQGHCAPRFRLRR